MKKLSVRLYSKNPNSKIGQFVKKVYLENDIFVDGISSIDGFVNSKMWTDCLILDFSLEISYEFDYSQIFADIHSLYKEGYISKIFVICDKEWLLPEGFTLILTQDLNKNVLLNYIDEIASCINLSNIEAMAKHRNIVINNLCSDGFSTKHNGTIMIVDVIIRAIFDGKMIINLRKDVYPFLMDKYKVSISCIELSMNKAIAYAYSKNNEKFLSPPTNKELLTYKICELYDFLTD